MNTTVRLGRTLLITVLPVISLCIPCSGQTGQTDFGEIRVGQTSPSQTVLTLHNLSSLFIARYRIKPTTGDFIRTGGTCAGTDLPGLLSINESCTVNVVFRPTQVGPRTGTLPYAVPLNTGEFTYVVALTGHGLPAPPPNRCDINGDGQNNVLDVQILVNQIVSFNSPLSSDINGDGVVNVLDLQRAVNAALGLGCIIN